MSFNPYAEAAIGAILIGAGVVLMWSAGTQLKDLAEPCVGCEDDAELAIEAVAIASAELIDNDALARKFEEDAAPRVRDAKGHFVKAVKAVVEEVKEVVAEPLPPVDPEVRSTLTGRRPKLPNRILEA
jgi:hypothetical protein